MPLYPPHQQSTTRTVINLITVHINVHLINLFISNYYGIAIPTYVITIPSSIHLQSIIRMQLIFLTYIYYIKSIYSEITTNKAQVLEFRKIDTYNPF